MRWGWEWKGDGLWVNLFGYFNKGGLGGILMTGQLGYVLGWDIGRVRMCVYLGYSWTGLAWLVGGSGYWSVTGYWVGRYLP